MNLLPLLFFLIATSAAVAAAQKTATVPQNDLVGLAKLKMKILEQAIEINKLKKMVDAKNSQPMPLSQCEVDLAAVKYKLDRIREIIG